RTRMIIEAKSLLDNLTESHQADAQAVLIKIRNYEAAVTKGRIFEGAKDFQGAKNAYAEAVGINPAGPATDLLTKAATAANVPSNTASNPPTNTTATVKPLTPNKPTIAEGAYIGRAQKARARYDCMK